MRELGLLAILIASGRVEAEPAIVLDRCATLDRVALRAAIDRELAAAPPDKRRDELTLVVRCPDAVTAHVSIEHKTSAPPVARSLDLGEVPQDLRIKLLAVAAVELVEVAAMTRPGDPRGGSAADRRESPSAERRPVEPAPPPAGSTRPTDRATSPDSTRQAARIAPPSDVSDRPTDRATSPGPTRPDNHAAGTTAEHEGAAPTVSGRRSTLDLGPSGSPALLGTPGAGRVPPAETDRVPATLRDGSPGAQRPPVPGRRVASALRGGEATARIERPRDTAFAVVPRLGVRVYPSRPIPLGHLAIDVELRWLTLGVASSLGTASDTLGTLTPYLVTATASSRWWCAGRIDRACVRARGELGVAGVAARGASQAIVASDARAAYGQLGVALEAAHSFGALAAVLGVDAAWAEGLVATAQDRAPVRLDGAVLTAVVGLRWSR